MRPVGAEPSPIAPNLSAIALDAHTAFASLRANYEEEIEAAMERLLGDLDASMDREAMRRILDLSPPGLDEVMALLRVVDLLEQPGPGLVVLDTAPTGHLLRLLHLPELIDQWIKAIFTLLLRYDKILRLTKVKADLVKISKGAKRLRALLTDSTASAVVPVCIPTEMALAETTDLLESCAAMKLSVPGLVVNLVTPEAGDDLTRALRTREAASLAGFTRTHGHVPQARISRLREPRGVEALASLGGAILGGTRLGAGASPVRAAA
jgi:arsenite-transporting ATPase